MADIKLREFSDYGRDRAGRSPANLPLHPLVTETIKTLTATATSQHVLLDAKTAVVEIETTADVRYCVTKVGEPIKPATTNHSKALSTGMTHVAVPQGSVISFITA